MSSSFRDAFFGSDNGLSVEAFDVDERRSRPQSRGRSTRAFFHDLCALERRRSSSGDDGVRAEKGGAQ